MKTYRLDLSDFCENCPNFEVKVDHMQYESGNYDDEEKNYYAMTCKMIDTCRKIYMRMLKEYKLEQQERSNNS